MNNESETASSSSSAVDFEKSIVKLLKANTNVKNFINSLFKMIPDVILSEKTSQKLVVYVLDNYELHLTKCKTVLQYVIGLLEYNLINFEAVDTFYFNYYKLLCVRTVAPLACQLIYMLTKDPNDINRCLVQRIRAGFHQNLPTTKQLNALLLLVKSLRPDLVPEQIPAFSLEHIFPLLPIAFRNDLENKKKSRQSKDVETSETDDIKWNLIKSTKSLNNTIPDVDLLNIESLYEKEWTMKTIIQYDNLIELQSSECSVTMLSNASSLLNNFAGRHFLTFGDELLKIRLIYYLRQTLRYEMQQLTPNSIKNLQELFKIILEFYKCAQQGIPDLSNLILEYFVEFGSMQFDETLLNLLSWTVVRSFDDLHKRLLRPLRDLLITRYSSVERCKIIDCVSDLIVNFVTCHLYPLLSGFKQPFPLNDVDDVEFFKKLGKWINFFSMEAIKVNGDGVLNSVLSLHQTLYHLQYRLEPVTWMGVAPSCVAYSCLGVSFHYLNSFCKLLLQYIELSKKVPDAKNELELTKTYLTTFYNLLNGTSMVISPEISKNLHGEEWTAAITSKLKKSFSYNIKSNLFLMPYVLKCMHNKEKITFDFALKICEIFYPHVYTFLQTMLPVY